MNWKLRKKKERKKANMPMKRYPTILEIKENQGKVNLNSY